MDMNLRGAGFGKLDNRHNYEFHKAFRDLVLAYPKVEKVVHVAFERYKVQLSKAEGLLGGMDEFDEDVRLNNRERLNVYNTFRDMIDVHCCDFNRDRKDAAEHIRGVLVGYGDLQGDDYHVKTGKIGVLIDTLKAVPYRNSVNILGKMDWLDELKRCNDVFDALLRGSQYDKKKELSNELRNVRNGLRTTCVLVFGLIELLLNVEEDETFEEFIKKVKELLKQYGVIDDK